MLASASGELKTRSEPNSVCRPAVSLKTPPLPLTSARALFAAGVGHVFAVDHDARIAAHLVVQAGVDQVGHGARSGRLWPTCSAGSGAVARSVAKAACGGIEILGVDVLGDARRLAGSGASSARSAASATSRSSPLLQLVDLLGGQNAFAQQAHLHAGDGIAQRVGLALGGGAVVLVVVGERVRVGPHAVAVDEGRALPGAAIGAAA